LGNSVPENEENDKLCLCPTCPTFKQSNLSNTVFCARGKAKKAVKAVGCLCPNCAVSEKYKLNQMYYCTYGKSADIKD
jgi:hypothetical protein